MKPKVSLMLFAGTLLCFLLPFVTISCGGQPVKTLTGVQLAIGTTVQQPQMFGPPKKQKVDSEPAAQICLLFVAIGLAASVIGGVSGSFAIVPALCGAGGAVSLLVLRSQLMGEASQQVGGMISVSFDSGISLAILLLFSAGGWNAWLFWNERHRPISGEVKHAPV